MSRNRAPITGGYVRKTISLPAALVARIEGHIENTGTTISSFLTVAGEDMLEKVTKKKR